MSTALRIETGAVAALTVVVAALMPKAHYYVRSLAHQQLPLGQEPQ